MLYTLEELAERCEVTLEFIETVRREGGKFQPWATITRLMEDPIQLYDSFDALMLLWIKAFVRHGWRFCDARRYAEDIVEGYFEEAENERFPWDNEKPPPGLIDEEDERRE